jgi:hypothetical protein
MIFLIAFPEPGFEALYREILYSKEPSKAALAAADSGRGWRTIDIDAKDEAQAREIFARKYPDRAIETIQRMR